MEYLTPAQQIADLQEKLAAKEQELKALKATHDRAVSTATQVFANSVNIDLLDATFISRQIAQGYIAAFQAGKLPGDYVAFFVDTEKMEKIINESKKSPSAPTTTKPDKIQIILGLKPSGEMTLVIVGALDNQTHVFYNNQVLENVWPEIAAGSYDPLNPAYGHASTVIYP